MVILETTNPSLEHLSTNLEIKGLAEMVGFTRFHGTYTRRDGDLCRDVPGPVLHSSRTVPVAQTS